MPRKPALHVMSALQERPWAIMPSALETLTRVAMRDTEALKPQLDAILAERGEPLRHTQHAELRDGVAILGVSGAMCRYASWFTDVSGLTSYEVLATDFTRVLNDASARAIILHLDTPGGEVSGVAEVAELIYRARGIKPIVAVVSDMAASAGYWLAAACDEIVATPCADVGCIGVMCSLRDYSAIDKAHGIETYTLVSSQTPKKIPDVRTGEGRAQLQSWLDASARVFLRAIATYRGCSEEEALTLAGEGRMFVGADAVTQGLADRVATTEAIIAELAAGGARPTARGRAAAIPAAAAAAASPLPESAMPKPSSPVAGAVANPAPTSALTADPAPTAAAAAAAPSGGGAQTAESAFAAGDEVTIAVARTCNVAVGTRGTVREVREAVTVVALDVAGADAGWFLADEEVSPVAEAADPAADPAPMPDAPTAATPLPSPAAGAPAIAVAFTDAATFAAQFPAIAEALRAEGATREQARAAAIRAACPVGFEAVADGCCADLACTPEAAALQFLEAQKAGGIDHLRAMRNAERALTPPAVLAPEDVAPSAQAHGRRIAEQFEASRPRPVRG